MSAEPSRTKSYDVKRSESKVEKSVENDIQCPLVIAVGDIYGLWKVTYAPYKPSRSGPAPTKGGWAGACAQRGGSARASMQTWFAATRRSGARVRTRREPDGTTGERRAYACVCLSLA